MAVFIGLDRFFFKDVGLQSSAAATRNATIKLLAALAPCVVFVGRTSINNRLQLGCFCLQSLKGFLMINALLTMSMRKKAPFEVWISFDCYNTCFVLMFFIFFCSTGDSASKKKRVVKTSASTSQFFCAGDMLGSLQ